MSLLEPVVTKIWRNAVPWKPAPVLSTQCFLGRLRSKTPAESKARLYAGFCAARCRAVAVILLGRRSRASSSHLPAASPSRIVGCLFGVAPRRDCPFHPPGFTLKRYAGRLVSVALILTSRWTGVTCYAALRSPDVPLAGEPASDRPADFASPIVSGGTLTAARLPKREWGGGFRRDGRHRARPGATAGARRSG